MILSMIDRYVQLCVKRLKLEQILKKLEERHNDDLSNEIKTELYRLNKSINFIHECIMKRLSTSTQTALSDLHKLLEYKSKKLRKEISTSQTTIKMIKDNAKIAVANKDKNAVKRYKELLEESESRRKEQLEELKCYDCVAIICSKVQYLSLRTN